MLTGRSGPEDSVWLETARATRNPPANHTDQRYTRSGYHVAAFSRAIMLFHSTRRDAVVAPVFRGLGRPLQHQQIVAAPPLDRSTSCCGRGLAGRPVSASTACAWPLPDGGQSRARRL